MDIIDLHMHSTASDGTDTPAELVAKAKKCGIKAIALTDHDTLKGIDEAKEAAISANIKFIPGCEISTSSEYGSHHILGLWIPQNNPWLNRFLDDAREIRKNRNQKMLDRLNRAGIMISPDDLEGNDLYSAGRPHIAMAMLKKGYIKNLREAFSQYIGKNGLAYVPKSSPEPEKAIRLLAQAGATVVLAHPLLQPLGPEVIEKLIQRFSRAGMSAIEVWHSSFSIDTSEYLLKLARKYALAPSGGSDYHGTAKPDILPGYGKNNLKISVRILENLEKVRRERGLPC